MKKSNKVSAFYVISSLCLLLVLAAGGIYGIYVSVGVNFARSTMSNMTGSVSEGISNYSYGGTVNFQGSMVGVIILSIVLVVLAVLDIISLAKQVVLFKQFKIVRESKVEQKIEKKIKSKGAILFFAVLIDILSLGVGIAGIFINSKAFVANNISWALYLIDGLVSLFALISLVLLIIKLKQLKKHKEDGNLKSSKDDEEENCEMETDNNSESQKGWFNISTSENLDVDGMEIKLLKLKYLKSCRLINSDEYESLRKKILNIENEQKSDEKVQEN